MSADSLKLITAFDCAVRRHDRALNATHDEHAAAEVELEATRNDLLAHMRPPRPVVVGRPNIDKVASRLRREGYLPQRETEDLIAYIRHLENE